jgi:hypothetical protein
MDIVIRFITIEKVRKIVTNKEKPRYRRSANVWRKRRLAHSLRATRWLTGNSDRTSRFEFLI